MILEVEALHHSFRQGFWLKPKKILEAVSFQISEKSIYGLLGANGAGKTSLIHLIVGLRRPTGGTVKFRGQESSSKKARSKMGYLPERPYFHEHLTGEGFLRFFGTLSGMDRPRMIARIEKVLNTVGMNYGRNTLLKDYSKGMLQRIGVAQAILHDPEFLVLDEPMSGLDPMGRKDMRDLISGLASEGRTVFFSTHLISDAEMICDQVGVLKEGRLVKSGSSESVLGRPSHYEIHLKGKPDWEPFKKFAAAEGISITAGLNLHRLVLNLYPDDLLKKTLNLILDQKLEIVSLQTVRSDFDLFREKLPVREIRSA